MVYDATLIKNSCDKKKKEAPCMRSSTYEAILNIAEIKANCFIIFHSLTRSLQPLSLRCFRKKFFYIYL